VTAAGALAGLLLLISFPAPARADGDPASDVLLGQDVFVTYSAPVSKQMQRELYAVTAAAARAGYPIRLALIAGKSDLGAVSSLYGRPQRYASFLSYELTGIVSAPVLVVMHAGFGLAVDGSARPTGALHGIAIGAGGDDLATAAVAATERLAAAAGHPLPAGAARAGGSVGASAGTVRHALSAIVVLAALAALGVGSGLRRRAR
jgi:hypothetical protein